MKTVLGVLAVTLMLSGCGTASKDDICGGCSGSLKEACELTYDACDDDGDCIDELEDANVCG